MRCLLGLSIVAVIGFAGPALADTQQQRADRYVACFIGQMAILLSDGDTWKASEDGAARLCKPLRTGFDERLIDDLLGAINDTFLGLEKRIHEHDRTSPRDGKLL